MLPLLAALALSCVIVGPLYAFAPYVEPVKPVQPVVNRALKDQSRIINVPWPVRAVTVETYRRADYEQSQLKAKTQATKPAARKKRARHHRRQHQHQPSSHYARGNW